MRWSVVCLIAAICVASVGCGEQHENDGSKRVSPERVTELENQLRTKPPFEAAQDEYRNAMRGMADQIAALVPGTTWNFVQDTFTDCGGDYVWTDAKEAYFLIGFSGPIPDEKWDRAVQIVKNGTSRFGATNLVVAENNSGDHDVSISGSDGVDFKLSSQKAAAFTGRSDCRM
jgi:hypothetical protein